MGSLQNVTLSLLGPHAHLSLLHLVWIFTCQQGLQCHNLSHQVLGIRSEDTNDGLDLIDTLLEMTASIDTNELRRCASTPELVVSGVRPAEHMSVAYAQNPGARLVVLGLVFVEEDVANYR